MTPFTIAIEHADNFFSAGIKSILQCYFDRQGRIVNFITLADNKMADLIIISEEKIRLARPCRIKKKTGCMLTVYDEYGTKNGHKSVCATEIGSFSRQDREEILLEYVVHVVQGVKSKPRSFRRCPCCSDSLVRIELDILRSISQGLSLSVIAKRLNVSIQSASRYKRSAMLKLGFERDHELYKWILRGGMEYEKRVLTW